MSTIVDSILDKFQEAQDKANAANLKRYQEGLNLYDQIIQQFSPGGSFGAGVEAQLGRARTKSLAQANQALVNAGLSNTTTAATLGKKFEEEVATPTRLQLEDLKAEKLANARSQKAAFIAAREDTGPDYATIAQLAMQAANKPQNTASQSPRYWGSNPDVGTDFFSGMGISPIYHRSPEKK